MKTWRGWTPVVLLGAAVVAVAYLAGSASANVSGCVDCNCKAVNIWWTTLTEYGEGLVDGNGHVVANGFGLCVAPDSCPGMLSQGAAGPSLDRREYTSPLSATCDNVNHPPSLCHGDVQELSLATLTTTVLGQTNQTNCTFNP